MGTLVTEKPDGRHGLGQDTLQLTVTECEDEQGS